MAEPIEAIDPGEALAFALETRTAEELTLKKVRRYVRGEHDLPYTPKSAREEYKDLVHKAVANWLPLIPRVLSQNMNLEGYRNPREAATASADPAEGGGSASETAWNAWLANGMDAKQTGVHRGALTYGTHYVVVLPGDLGPVVKPVSALNMTAIYGEDDEDWPLVAAHFSRVRREGEMMRRVVVYDATDRRVWIGKADAKEAKDFELESEEAHGMPVCPVVRFLNEYPDEDGLAVQGEIEPYIPIQDRLNETTLGLLMAQQYSAFRQKWATGMVIPIDPETGERIEPFKSAVDRMFMNEDPNGKFGSFDQTDLSGYLESLDQGIKHLSAIAQIPPHYLIGAVANLSAEALAAAEAGLSRKVSERKSLFGVSWGQVMRLACVAARVEPDLGATVIWRDTEARALAATVDAFGKLAQMLGVPPEALWEKLPGVTVDDVRSWRAMKEAQAAADPMAQLASTLSAQGAMEAEPVPEAA